MPHTPKDMRAHVTSKTSEQQNKIQTCYEFRTDQLYVVGKMKRQDHKLAENPPHKSGFHNCAFTRCIRNPALTGATFPITVRRDKPAWSRG
jgi:hypothetical protein